MDPGIAINFSNIPGLVLFRSLFGSVLGGVFMILVPLLALGAVAWAFGSITNRPGTATTGKMAVVVILGAAFVVGGANALIKWAVGLGGQV